MKDTTLDALATLLSVRLGKQEHAKSEIPLPNANADDIAKGAGIKKWDDHRPSLQMMPKADPGSKAQPLDMEWFAVDPQAATEAYERQWTDQLAYKTESDGRREPLDEGRKDKSKRRMRASRARAKRKQQMEQIEKVTVMPEPERLAQAWDVVVPMLDIVKGITTAKEQWAARHLGTIASDDVPSLVIEKMVITLAKSDQDLDALTQAALELGGEVKRTGRVPGHQPTDEERAEAKKITMAKKWLLSATNNWVMNVLTDLYRASENVRFENIDKIDTIMANINGVGEDPMVARHKADRAPAMLGSKWQAPGDINRDALAMMIAAAITDRKLDALTELLINEDNLRVDGCFRWSDLAQEVFLATEDGPYKWHIVDSLTSEKANPRIAQAAMARRYVRSLYAFLPGLIVDAVHTFDYVSVGSIYRNGQIRATVLNAFEAYLTSSPRTVLRPTLSYATPEDAARAIVENLSVLITGEDIVKSVVHA